MLIPLFLQAVSSRGSSRRSRFFRSDNYNSLFRDYPWCWPLWRISHRRTPCKTMPRLYSFYHHLPSNRRRFFRPSNISPPDKRRKKMLSWRISRRRKSHTMFARSFRLPRLLSDHRLLPLLSHRQTLLYIYHSVFQNRPYSGQQTCRHRSAYRHLFPRYSPRWLYIRAELRSHTYNHLDSQHMTYHLLCISHSGRSSNLQILSYWYICPVSDRKHIFYY